MNPSVVPNIFLLPNLRLRRLFSHPFDGFHTYSSITIITSIKMLIVIAAVYKYQNNQDLLVAFALIDSFSIT